MFNSRESVVNWNMRCGNTPKVLYSPEYWESLKSQSLCMLEEAKELIAAVEAKDPVETLDAQADLQYVLDGLVFLSQHDHDGAMKAVCHNNNLKYTDDYQEAVSRMFDIEKRTGDECFIRQSIVEGKEWFAIVRKSDGKIMKQSNLPKVQLATYIAEVESEELFVVVSDTCIICQGLLGSLRSLGVDNFTEVTPISSKADRDFCKDNNLWVADIVYYDGEKFHTTSYPKLNYDANNLKNWLKGVGYNGFTEH
ncbi:phosphoribosyl-ATP pyrophosphohydrolase [Shigella phage Silverhawkium]|uniref:Phosphoribosyl-ATP pyrophosphohydrolase n=1 Tax=Shigella phage Silverhawkium TaxID=2530185 RepID=A0A482JM71_9CAUD|nr:phosphoribosyl-ATP pyrophosphohydrolase [Shigella phage Silverhawkium]